ncbi:MAG: OmpH family outer membrane protein [Paludibacteraceae bacterium]
MYKKLFFVLALLSAVALHAQVATINSQKVLASIPQVAKADTLAMQEQQRLSREYGKMRYETQLQIGVADSLYRVNPNDAVTKAAVEKAQKAQQDLAKYEQEANKKLADYRNVLLTPYIDKVNAAVKAVAIRLKYKQVIDMQAVPLAYASEDSDITDTVIKELKK